MFAYLKNPEHLDEIKAGAATHQVIVVISLRDVAVLNCFHSMDSSTKEDPECFLSSLFAMGSELVKPKSALPQGSEAAVFSLVLVCLNK